MEPRSPGQERAWPGFSGRIFSWRERSTYTMLNHWLQQSENRQQEAVERITSGLREQCHEIIHDDPCEKIEKWLDDVEISLVALDLARKINRPAALIETAVRRWLRKHPRQNKIKIYLPKLV